MGTWNHADGTVETFPFQQGTPFRITSGYGMRRHPIRGDMRFHAGIDLAAPTGTVTRTIGGGQVIRVGNTDPNGYGNVVAVRTPSGHVEHFAHLNSMTVRVGDVLQPGTQVGTVGSTGGSTGPHLDLSIWKPGVELYSSPAQNTIDPRVYFQTVRGTSVTSRGVGANPSSSPSPQSNTAQLSSTVTDGFSSTFRSLYESVANYTRNRVGVNPASSVSSSAPRNSGVAALHRNAYTAGNRNNPEHNFGYAAIANDRSYRIALAQTSASLNIPTQWLADVIDFETGGTHNPSTPNRSGCVGLLQACPTGMLADLAQKWRVNVTVATRRLGSMTRAQYLQEAQWWLARYSENGRLLNTIEDLYSLVNGGPNALRMSVNRRRGVNDRNAQGQGGQLVDHFRQLGSRVGRRYESSYDRTQSNLGSTHTGFVAGCIECARMQNQLGTITPHSGRTS